MLGREFLATRKRVCALPVSGGGLWRLEDGLLMRQELACSRGSDIKRTRDSLCQYDKYCRVAAIDRS